MHTKREKASFPVSVRRSKTPYPSVSTKIACEQAIRSLSFGPLPPERLREFARSLIRRRKVGAYFAYFSFC